ncbi:MAG: type II toxin-antitoxin system RelE/ParE family toxin [Nitrospirales bacterium]
MSFVIQLSERAQKDLKAIQRYTLKQHGEKQVLKYAAMIKTGLEAVANDPVLHGHVRPDIPERYRAHQVGKHSIIYRVNGHTIFVIAILHGSMDFMSRLS